MMKITVMTLAVAAALGAAVSPGFAQDKLKAASPAAAPEGAQEMPKAGGTQSAVTGGQAASGSAKLGNEGAAAKVGTSGLVAAPGTLTKVKSTNQ
jgi:hypothetical protein